MEAGNSTLHVELVLAPLQVTVVIMMLVAAVATTWPWASFQVIVPVSQAELWYQVVSAV